jgi:hypothetical protein
LQGFDKVMHGKPSRLCQALAWWRLVWDGMKQWFHLQQILVWNTSQLVIDYLVWLIGWMEGMNYHYTYK